MDVTMNYYTQDIWTWWFAIYLYSRRARRRDSDGRLSDRYVHETPQGTGALGCHLRHRHAESWVRGCCSGTCWIISR